MLNRRDRLAAPLPPYRQATDQGIRGDSSDARSARRRPAAGARRGARGRRVLRTANGGRGDGERVAGGERVLDRLVELLLGHCAPLARRLFRAVFHLNRSAAPCGAKPPLRRRSFQWTSRIYVPRERKQGGGISAAAKTSAVRSDGMTYCVGILDGSDDVLGWRPGYARKRGISSVALTQLP